METPAKYEELDKGSDETDAAFADRCWEYDRARSGRRSGLLSSNQQSISYLPIKLRAVKFFMILMSFLLFMTSNSYIKDLFCGQLCSTITC